MEEKAENTDLVSIEYLDGLVKRAKTGSVDSLNDFDRALLAVMGALRNYYQGNIDIDGYNEKLSAAVDALDDAYFEMGDLIDMAEDEQASDQ